MRLIGEKVSDHLLEDAMTQPGGDEPASHDTTIPPLPAMPRAMEERRRPVISWLAVAGVLIVGILLVRTVVAYPLLPIRGGLVAATATPGLTQAGGAQSSAQAPQVSAPGYNLYGVSMSSPTNGWAVGFDGSGSAPSPVLLRYTGDRWTRAQAPIADSLFSIVALADDDAWASSSSGILHYSGGRWALDYAAPDQSAIYTHLAMLSDDEGWAVGESTSGAGSAAVILHRRGGAWTPEEVPALSGSVNLRGISMRSPYEGWVVGQRYAGGGSQSAALHYTGGRWVEEDDGLPAGAAEGVAAVGPGEAWAVGYAGGVGPGYIEHYQGGRWYRVSSPTPNMLHAIQMLSPTQGWIAGDGAATLRLAPNGTWVKEGLIIHGVALSGISMTSPSEGWAVGGQVILHCHNSVWSLYKLQS